VAELPFGREWDSLREIWEILADPAKWRQYQVDYITDSTAHPAGQHAYHEYYFPEEDRPEIPFPAAPSCTILPESALQYRLTGNHFAG
jgi:hypothetical protein